MITTRNKKKRRSWRGHFRREWNEQKSRGLCWRLFSLSLSICVSLCIRNSIYLHETRAMQCARERERHTHTRTENRQQSAWVSNERERQKNIVRASDDASPTKLRYVFYNSEKRQWTRHSLSLKIHIHTCD